MRKFEDKFVVQHNFESTFITKDSLRGSIEHCYDTLDMIDKNLVSRGVSQLSQLVELANLSSIVGNLLGAGFAENSAGKYYRNKPHTYPDLLPIDLEEPGIEIKTALRKNSPKGHQPKEGYYLIYRYCLTDENGRVDTVKDELLNTVTIWEVKFGYLLSSDFSCSNTEGDSGKTAVIRTETLNKMPLLYLNTECIPYKKYKGYN